MSSPRLGFEDDADGNPVPVGVQDFDMEEVYRRLDGEADNENPEKEAVRIALRAVLDVIIPQKTRGDRILKAAARNVVLLAYACGHSSMQNHKMTDIVKLLGISGTGAYTQLERVKKRAGIGR